MPETTTPHPTPEDCTGSLHFKAVEGITLFNARQYWKAHEALEVAWLAEPGQARHLYRGILQVGVTYLHIQRRNLRGALKVYERSRRWLNPFPERCCGVNVAQLKVDLEAAIAEVTRLGPDGLAAFDAALLRPIYFDGK
jgi:hypothetical protein